MISFLFALAAIVFSIFSLAPVAYAQLVTIATSADAYSNRFFGEAVIQVVLVDPQSDDSNNIEDISVSIKARPDSGSADSTSIVVPETNDGSGKFEFFLAHVDAMVVAPDDLHPLNSAGVEGDGTCAANCAPLITFGPMGDLDIQSELYEPVSFEINSGNVQLEVNYEETVGTLELDRYAYGTTSFVYISIKDQDANLNPFESDEFTVDPDNIPNNDLLALDGGTFEEAILFRETGDNTGIFKGRYGLGVSITVESESLLLTLHEKANYATSLTAPENDSNNIDEISFTVGNSDGTIDVGGGQQPSATWDPNFATDKVSYAVGDRAHVTITDRDANVNPNSVDSIKISLSSSGELDEALATETGANTGIFEATFMIVREADITVGYTDKWPADYYEKVSNGQSPEKEFTLKIGVTPALKEGIEATTVTAPTPSSGPHTVGNQLTLSTTIANNNDMEQTFVAVIEVRDGRGVTVFLEVQDGTLDPSGSTNIEVVWQPEIAGVFQTRTFTFSQLVGGEVLSPVAASQITVSQAK